MKNNIRIIVQDRLESAKDFAVRLETYINELSINCDNLVTIPPEISAMTSSHDGRQTATIQFFTDDNSNTGESLFNGFDLRFAYDNFMEEFERTNETDRLIEFLIEQKERDYE